MPKKQSRNSFYYFMLDFKAREEKKGRQFPNGLKDVQQDSKCSQEWQSMTPQEKRVYEMRSKDSKIRDRGKQGRLTCTGESLDFVEQEAKKAQEFEENMNDFIKNTISLAVQHENLASTKFYFIHVNYFIRRPIENNRHDHYPAEFAVGEFSLENGMANIYHETIHMKAPLGYTREALETIQETHRIPLELEGGEKDFYAMYQKLIDFLKSDTNNSNGKLPPLYTMKNNSAAVPDLLRRLARAAEEEDDKFTVYSLETLFASLRNAAGDQCNINMIPLAERDLRNDSFSHTLGLECEFHQKLDGAKFFCSQSIIKRWAFIICDNCCEKLGIETIPGIHCPVAVSESTGNCLELLSDNMNSMTLMEKMGSVLSMTGVSEEHRRKASERTHAEEQRRRADSKDLHIIDHSKLPKEPIPQPIPERPLRRPKTKGYAWAAGEMEPPQLNDADFPAIGGRGVALKRNLADRVPGRGRGGGAPHPN
ncbi:protein maelstrom homolog [Orussus abietinus]|uniref:protein maelstrom homolog n=1 Tax=Orussus abietinus TaxID=222816 RepID=UPI0006264415|nr:protein maelstrom homolog [Orussus abietinus]